VLIFQYGHFYLCFRIRFSFVLDVSSRLLSAGLCSVTRVCEKGIMVNPMRTGSIANK